MPRGRVEEADEGGVGRVDEVELVVRPASDDEVGLAHEVDIFGVRGGQLVVHACR